MNDLVMRLRLFADCAIDDLSIGEEAADEIEKLRDEAAWLRNMAVFGMEVLKEHREDCNDIDGDWLEDTAKKHGLLTTFTATEACSENCRCATFMYDNDWPTECLRYSPAALKAFRVLEKSDEE
jgi:hypothetical protein